MHALLVVALLSGASPARFGKISFPVTGSKECQKHFTQGMLALHSFFYEQAHESFQLASQADPGCAMAFWGNAMAYSHPIWGEEELEPARESLGKIRPEQRLTPKERGYIEAARTLFGAGDRAERQRGWLEAASRMAERFSEDNEVTLQHALALIVNSDHFLNTGRLMEAAAKAFEVLQRNPEHPGAAHYAIHACDSPDHAVLALPAARQYAKIAPAASHALHMPSHIFVQLGMWPEAASSNEASWAASQARAERKKLSLEERDYHSYIWLAAAYFEMGQIKKAEGMVINLAEWTAEEDGPEKRFAYVNLAQLDLTDGQRWDKTEALLAPISKPLPLEPGEAAGSLGCALHAPGAAGKVRPPIGLISLLREKTIRAESAARKGNEATVRQQIEEAQKIREAMRPWLKTLHRNRQASQALRESAWLASARAHRAKTAQTWTEAIEALRKLADLEDSESSAGPAFEAPARQQLAELELEAGKPELALGDFDRTLDKHPMLSRALLGAARAAKASGKAAIARERYAALANLWKNADPGLAELAEVRGGAAIAAR
jgi:tetratricopeptide (TPR) repeat protein